MLLRDMLLLQMDLSVAATDITAFALLILTLLFLVSLSAAAEVAFFNLNIKDINYLKTKGLPGHKQALRLLDRPDLLLASLRASKYLLATIIILCALYLVAAYSSLSYLNYVLVILAILFILVFFGEILPKVYARENTVKMAVFSAPIVRVLLFLFHPAAKLMIDSLAYKEEKQIKQEVADTSSESFMNMVQLSIGKDISKEELEIFKSIFKFGKITVKQIMHPRLDIGAIPHSWNFSQVLKKMENAGYSRMPVYEKNIDNIIGMVYTKDFLPYQDLDSFDWHTLIRPAFFVHERKLINQLLREFQQKAVHLAIVVDEFGGTSGIVTLEDVMEEIIGDIRDEFDEEILKYKKVDDNNYIFESKILINDMCRIIGVASTEFQTVRGQSDSLAGLLLEIKGKFPKMNDRISYKQYDFTVLSIDGLRIGKVKLEVLDT